jgi:hypothetical protein
MKFFQSIKLLAGTITAFFKKSFSHIGDVLTVVDIIKSAVNSPAFDFIAALGGHGWEPALLAKIREALTVAVAALNIADECNQQPDDASKLMCLVSKLRDMSPAMRSAVYAKLGSLVTLHLSEYKLTPTEADTYTQLAYAERKASTQATA